jgi:hypothetical protein
MAHLYCTVLQDYENVDGYCVYTSVIFVCVCVRVRERGGSGFYEYNHIYILEVQALEY